jgi:alpha-tubulin suppressor-like RCC1 family protein
MDQSMGKAVLIESGVFAAAKRWRAVLLAVLVLFVIVPTVIRDSALGAPPADFGQTIAAGTSHTDVLRSDGTVWTFGSNTYEQLGRPNTLAYPEPNPVPGLVPGLTGVTAIAAGSDHTVALRADGTVWTFGFNGYGQLGRVTRPAAAQDRTAVQVAGLTQVTAVAAGAYHTLALRSDGTVWAFGDNRSGDLGRTTLSSDYNPGATQVPGLSGVTALAAGYYHTAVLRSDGTVWTFGDNRSGQLGRATNPGFSPDFAPTKVTEIKNATAVAAGGYRTVILLADGTVWTFGRNSYGELGRVTNPVFRDSVPTKVQGLGGVTAIAAGAFQTLALRSDSTLWSFGWNSGGQLGYATVLSEPNPTPSPIPGLSGISSMAGGYNHTLVLRSDGTLWTFGYNESGDLGRVTAAKFPNPNPSPVAELSGIAQPALFQTTPIAPSSFTALTPARILDSRNGLGTPTHQLESGETVAIQVSGVGGVPEQATSAVMNVTVTGATEGGYFTLYPCDAPRPNASNLNFVAGQTVPNLVSVRLSRLGQACLFTSSPAFAIADVAGFYSLTGERFVPLTPSRVLDSRNGIGTTKHKIAGGEVVALQVSGRGGVTTGVTAAVLNVTATNPSAGGYLSVYPCDQTRPDASNLNFTSGLTIANLVFARLDRLGRTCLFTTAPVDVIADTAGFFAAEGVLHTPLVPARILDTRSGIGIIKAKLDGGQTAVVQVSGFGGVGPGSAAAVLNVTVANPETGGYLTIYPCNASRPEASSLNFDTGVTVPNLAVASLDPSGKTCVYSTARTDLLVDVSGEMSR